MDSINNISFKKRDYKNENGMIGLKADLFRKSRLIGNKKIINNFSNKYSSFKNNAYNNKSKFNLPHINYNNKQFILKEYNYKKNYNYNYSQNNIHNINKKIMYI